MLLVAHGAVDGALELWLGAHQSAPPTSPVTLRMEHEGGAVERTLDVSWRRTPTDDAPYFVSRARWEDVPEAGPIRLSVLTPDGEIVGPRVQVRPLPAALPREDSGEDPLVLGLSSCFFRPRAGSSAVGALPRTLSRCRLPHLKFVCGDQVYLDLPVLRRHPRDDRALGRHLADNYWRTWSQGASGGDGGFADYLAWGANWFIADDHEFWNNYPYSTPVASSTWRTQGRMNWTLFALRLFDDFQRRPRPGGRTLARWRVGAEGAPGSLEVAAIDGRYPRTRARSHQPDDLAEVVQWLSALQGPGVLVLSQPLFEAPMGWWRTRMVDAGIVDLDDFPELARALAAAPHDVLLLSGDIHGGRVAVAEGAPGRSRLYEVVSSPTALCVPGSHRTKGAHPRFPSVPVPGLAPRSVRMLTGCVAEDHVATLSFVRAGDAVRVRAEFWSPQTPSRLLAAHEFNLR